MVFQLESHSKKSEDTYIFDEDSPRMHLDSD